MEPVLSAAARCERLLADHLAAAVQRFGASALGVIDLPPLDEVGQVNAAQLRAAGTLLWASHVERSGLLDFVDALARGAVDGTLQLPVTGAVADTLGNFWLGRVDRFDKAERVAIYQRLFGDESEPDHPVASLLRSLCAALIAIDGAAHAGEAQRARIRASAAARAFASELSERAVGITGFAAREIVVHVRQALALASSPELARALGSTGPWQAIRLWSLQLLGRRIDPTRPLEQARAGLALLEWIADNAALLEQEGTLEPAPEVIAAAASYVAEGQA
jgi:hypothetical protein